MDWDSSWEAEVLSRTEHCEIWGFDYTQEGFGPDVRSMKHRTHFQQLQLGPKDTHGPDDDPKAYTLQSIMLENGIIKFLYNMPEYLNFLQVIRISTF